MTSGAFWKGVWRSSFQSLTRGLATDGCSIHWPVFHYLTCSKKEKGKIRKSYPCKAMISDNEDVKQMNFLPDLKDGVSIQASHA